MTASSDEEVDQADATPSAYTQEQSAPVEAAEVSEAAEIVEAAETVEAVEAVVAIQSAENTTQPAEVVVENTQTPEAAAEAPTDVAAQP